MNFTHNVLKNASDYLKNSFNRKLEDNQFLLHWHAVNKQYSKSLKRLKRYQVNPYPDRLVPRSTCTREVHS